MSTDITRMFFDQTSDTQVGPGAMVQREDLRPLDTERYEVIGTLGIGGMGEVLRVRDKHLNRTLAMKTIRGDLDDVQAAESRFFQEAQATAQLQHPGIVPVHDFGVLEDGRLYFLMRELRGQTLGQVIKDLHGPDLAPKWPRRRVVELFRNAVEAVAFAHDRGVVHRDLKPANILVGDYGEVMVVDWGIAKVLADLTEPGEHSAGGHAEGPIRTTRTDRGDTTRMGLMPGTPRYMAPEQRRGDVHEIGPETDVFALGGVLFYIVTGHHERHVPVSTTADELVQIARVALSDDRQDRQPSAKVLAAQLTSWLDGARRLEEATELTERADAIAVDMEDMTETAAERRREGEAMLAGLSPTAPLEDKRQAWGMQDQAAAMEREVAAREVEQVQLLRAALIRYPEHREARRALATTYHRRHVAAEAAGDITEATRMEALLAHHDDGHFASYLEGTGRLALTTDPRDAVATVSRFVSSDRRLVPQAVLQVAAPFEVELPQGSYLITLRADGRAPVRYPALLRRGHAWNCTPPGSTEPMPVRIPVGIGDDEIFVPAGWCTLGGDRDLYSTPFPPGQAWVDDFVIRRFQVTYREYFAFLDDLTTSGGEELGQRYAPLAAADSTSGVEWRDGRAAMKGFVHPDMLVAQVGWHDAVAFAAWESDRTGLPWRLVGDAEWEKAARGVDGRTLPWGNTLDPSFAAYIESAAAAPSWSDFPLDESPYGVRGMAGGVQEWCADGFDPQPTLVDGRFPHVPPSDDACVVRGGACRLQRPSLRSPQRAWEHPGNRSFMMGFRLARSL